MASWMILRRSIYPAATTRYFNWNYAPQSVRGISSSSSSSAAAAPWLLIEDGMEKLYNFYRLDDHTVEKMKRSTRAKDGMVVGSSHGWLALYKSRLSSYKWRRVRQSCGYDMFLYNPVSNRCINLPSVETLPTPRNESLYISIYKLNRPKKVILSCSPDDKDEECRVIMSFGPEDRLALWSPGLCKEWTPINDYDNDDDDSTPNRIYEDFVFSTRKKQLFCTTSVGEFESWDIFPSSSRPRLNWKIVENEMVFDPNNYPWSYRSEEEYITKKHCCRMYKYLVFAEKSNQLFLVRRCVMERIGPKVDPPGSVWYYCPREGPYQTTGFDVHKIIVGDENKNIKGELRYMDGTLDGMSFFIGSGGHGFVVEEEDEMIKNRVVEPNSIYFTDPKELTPPPWEKFPTLYGGHDIGIFNYRNRTVSSCYYPLDIRSFKRIQPTPTWFTPSH